MAELRYRRQDPQEHHITAERHYQAATQHGQEAAEHAQQSLSNFTNYLTDKTPPARHILVILTMFPIGGVLLLLSGLTLTGTLIGTAVSTPLFLIFSPIILPAISVVGLAVAGFIASGAFGITAVSSLSWIVNYVRRVRAEYYYRRGGGGGVFEELGEFVGEKTKGLGQGIQEVGEYVGQKTKDVGQGIENTSRELGQERGKHDKDVGHGSLVKTKEVKTKTAYDVKGAAA